MGLNFPDYQQAFDSGAMIAAEDVHSLADQTRLPLSALQDTLQKIDNLALNNEVDEYGRRFNIDAQLKAPYYAIKVSPAVFHTQGGLAINEHAQVIDDNEQPISSLLAAGGAACGVSGSSVAGYLSGNGLLTAVTLGRIA